MVKAGARMRRIDEQVMMEVLSFIKSGAADRCSRLLFVLQFFPPGEYYVREVQKMIPRDKKTADPAVPEKGPTAIAPRPGAAGEDDCRCKDASKKTPRELLKTMWTDLAFWKKG